LLTSVPILIIPFSINPTLSITLSCTLSAFGVYAIDEAPRPMASSKWKRTLNAIDATAREIPWIGFDQVVNTVGRNFNTLRNRTKPRAAGGILHELRAMRGECSSHVSSDQVNRHIPRTFVPLVRARPVSPHDVNQLMEVDPRGLTGIEFMKSRPDQDGFPVRSRRNLHSKFLVVLPFRRRDDISKFWQVPLEQLCQPWPL
jgi:hypothetical protein